MPVLVLAPAHAAASLTINGSAAALAIIAGVALLLLVDSPVRCS